MNLPARFEMSTKSVEKIAAGENLLGKIYEEATIIENIILSQSVGTDHTALVMDKSKPAPRLG